MVVTRHKTHNYETGASNILWHQISRLENDLELIANFDTKSPEVPVMR